MKDARGEEEEVCGQVRWHAIDSSMNFCICRWIDLLKSYFPGKVPWILLFTLLEIS